MDGLSMTQGLLFDRMKRGYEDQIYEYQVTIGKWRKANENLASQLATTENDFAYVLALRCAMETLISQVWGATDHPLNFDKSLRESIGNAGTKAFRAANDWDAAKEAGRKFPLPPMLDPHFDCTSASIADADRIVAKREIEELKEKVAELTSALASGLAVGGAFLGQLTLVDPKNPWIEDESLHEKAGKIGLEQFNAAERTDVRVATQAGYDLGFQIIK